ncbi:hypothetical protein PQR33_31425 [Paraburkholderia sediminicola]|uniref:hypothetical protein n=1 Tax=Paraburkholderia sediminicola TaxID=458836 RepID=UPI0038B94AFB
MTEQETVSRKQSFHNLLKFLFEVRDNPTKFASYDGLASSLSRQSRLGEYSNVSRHIRATSRQTLQRFADKELEGGRGEFDELRLAALKAIQSVADAGMKPAMGLTARLIAEIAILKDEREQAQLDCYQLSAAFHDAIAAARSLVEWSRNEVLRARWKKEEKVLLEMRRFACHSATTLRSPPPNQRDT